MPMKFNHYEIFPDEHIQKKLNILVSPYNNTLNFKKWMNFNEIEDQLENKNFSNKWIKISDLILKNDDWFLRKSLRLINQQLYKSYDQISKNLKTTRIKSRGRMQSNIKDRNLKQNEMNYERSTFSKVTGEMWLLKAPKITQSKEIKIMEDEVNEKDISKVIWMMKFACNEQNNLTFSKQNKECESNNNTPWKSILNISFNRFLKEISLKSRYKIKDTFKLHKINSETSKYLQMISKIQPILHSK